MTKTRSSAFSPMATCVGHLMTGIDVHNTTMEAVMHPGCKTIGRQCAGGRGRCTCWKKTRLRRCWCRRRRQACGRTEHSRPVSRGGAMSTTNGKSRLSALEAGRLRHRRGIHRRSFLPVGRWHREQGIQHPGWLRYPLPDESSGREVAVISGRHSAAVEKRMAELGVQHVILRVAATR